MPWPLNYPANKAWRGSWHKPSITRSVPSARLNPELCGGVVPPEFLFVRPGLTTGLRASPTPPPLSPLGARRETPLRREDHRGTPPRLFMTRVGMQIDPDSIPTLRH